jgi:hypothetical protein
MKEELIVSNSKLEIEKDVPLPYKLPEIPFSEMSVGDSVLVKLKQESDLATTRQRCWRENSKKKARYSCTQVSNNAARVFRIL